MVGVGPVKTQSRCAKMRQDAPQTGGQFPECLHTMQLAAHLPQSLPQGRSIDPRASESVPPHASMQAATPPGDRPVPPLPSPFPSPAATRVDRLHGVILHGFPCVSPGSVFSCTVLWRPYVDVRARLVRCRGAARVGRTRPARRVHCPRCLGGAPADARFASASGPRQASPGGPLSPKGRAHLQLDHAHIFTLVPGADPPRYSKRVTKTATRRWAASTRRRGRRRHREPRLVHAPASLLGFHCHSCEPRK